MADFKFTIDIEKAEESDGNLFIYGTATGLGLDSQGHEMDPAAIDRFQQQIRARVDSGDPVPFMDWHQKDGLLKQLGDVVEGTVDADWNLGVKVQLDRDNPAALYLYKQLKKGKKFGMSVAGKAQTWVRRFDDNLKQTVLRFTDVAMTEVSATTKPIWTPSFGTVLAKSVIDEADAESVLSEGDSPEMSKNDTEGLSEEATETAPADETATTDAPEAEVNDEAAETADGVDIEKAGARYSKTTRAKFLSMYLEMGNMLREEGILEDEDPDTVEKSETSDEPAAEADTTTETTDTSDSPEPEDKADEPAADVPADKADEGQGDTVESLRAALAEMTERAEKAEALAAEKPKAPQMVVRADAAKPDEADEERKRLLSLPPAQRLAEAFRIREATR